MAEFSEKKHEKVSTKVPVYPLSESVFERMNSQNPPSLRYLKAPVVCNEDVYALGRDCKGDGKLYKYSLSNNDWSNFSIPSSIYASYSVLTTYNSKLLLISGDNMTLWEFSNNNFAFKESSINPVPSMYLLRHSCTPKFAISSDKYLIITCDSYLCGRSTFKQLIYNGRDWKLRQLKSMDSSQSCFDVVAVDSHAVFMIESSNWCNNVYIWRSLISNFEDEDVGYWEMLKMMSLEEFDAMLHGWKYSCIVQHQQFYCVNLQGVIFTAFLQPPIVPILWGKSGVTFDQAPRLVGLPDGALLMIGTIRHQDQGSQLDIIKVSQKDHKYNPGSYLTMKALVTLEWGMNTPVLTKLQSSQFENLKQLTNVPAKELTRIQEWEDFGSQESINEMLDDSQDKISLKFNIEKFKYIKSWINSTDSVPQPTWRNFFRVLQDISPELGELAYQIKEIFHATEAAEDTAKLKSELIQLQSSSKSDDEKMARGLESSVVLCENILQKIQKLDEEREQLAKQLQSKAEEVTKLNEQLKLYEQAEDENKTRQLTNKDLPLLLRQLKIHAAKWREIGIHLGFLTGELASIEARPNLSHSAPLSWLVAMLEEWLQWAPGDSRGSTSFATLEDLTDALSEVGLGASACDLKLKITST